MPGIAGFITKKPRAAVEPQLHRMLQTLHHEPFYVTGTWIDESLGVYVGWTALPGSFSAEMPIADETAGAHLVLSGEEYSAGSPSGFPRLYRSDPSFPLSLNGLFHGLLADRERGTATLFNDRYGMHRLYFHQADGAFYFAAEAKAILAVCPELRTIDPRGLGEFVSFSCVLENRTIFKDIHILPGASSWIFRNGELDRKATYFQPREWEQQETLDPEAFYRELRDVFSRNLPHYFAGPQRVGMTLTGGMDTRVIMAWHRPAPRSIACYTFGSMYRDNHDVRLARRVAQVRQQTHEVITVGQEFLSRFPHYAERSVSMTEGGIDVYRAADLFVSERARALAPVKVVGTYGSEIVRHAVMFKPMPVSRDLFRADFMPSVQQASATYFELRHQHPVTFAAFRQSPWFHSRILALEQSQLSVRAPFLDNDFVRAMFRAPLNLQDDVRLRLIRDGDSALAAFRTDRGYGGTAGPVANALSRALLEFSFKAEYAYDYGMPQWVSRLDHAVAPLHLERLFLGRHKLLHFRMWYRHQLADYVRQILLDPKTLARPYLERKGVEAIVRGHLQEGRNHTTEIHKLLTLELLQRLFFDQRREAV